MKIRLEQSGKSLDLLNDLLDAHSCAAENNNNVSSAIYGMSFAGSGNVINGICSALLSIGWLHAPLEDARWLWCNATEETIDEMFRCGQKVPGFGNSFYKDRIDPCFDKVYNAICSVPHLKERMQYLTERVRAHKKLYPNAALITEAVCEEVGIPFGKEGALFALARIPAWTGLKEV